MSLLINEGSHVFIDISSELYRKYTFPNKEVIKIRGCTHLAISGSGHRLFDGKKSYFIPFGWIILEWEAKEGQPNFVK